MSERENTASGTNPPDKNYIEPNPTLFDLVLLLLKDRKILLIVVGLFACLGLFLAIVSDSEYTAYATIISEDQTDGAGAMGGLSLLKGLGINLTGGATGLTADTYPDVLMSRDVRLAVVRDSFFFPELGKRTTYTEYATQPTLVSTIKRNTIRVPGRILAYLNDSGQPSGSSSGPGRFPSREEEIAMRSLTDIVEPIVAQTTGLLTVSVTTNSATLSAELNERLITHLEEQLEILRTEKARRNLAFITEKFDEAYQDLIEAEDALAEFSDRNINAQSAELRMVKSRLERELRFKSELYSDLQTQLTQEKLEYERTRPVITVIDHPAPPIIPSGPNRLLILITSLMLGTSLGITIILSKALVDKIKQQEEAQKIAEFNSAFQGLKKIKHSLRLSRTRDKLNN